MQEVECRGEFRQEGNQGSRRPTLSSQPTCDAVAALLFKSTKALTIGGKRMGKDKRAIGLAYKRNGKADHTRVSTTERLSLSLDDRGFNTCHIWAVHNVS
jgi:hypothetical protein